MAAAFQVSIDCADPARLAELSQDGLDHFGIVLQDPEGNEFCLH